MTTKSEYFDQLVVERRVHVDHSDPTTWWTPAEQAQHRAELEAVVNQNLNVRALVDSHRKDQWVDWVVVERLCAGRPTRANPAEKLEALRYMVGHRYDYRDMQERLHLSGSSMRRLMMKLEVQP